MENYKTINELFEAGERAFYVIKCNQIQDKKEFSGDLKNLECNNCEMNRVSMSGNTSLCADLSSAGGIKETPKKGRLPACRSEKVVIIEVFQRIGD